MLSERSLIIMALVVSLLGLASLFIILHVAQLPIEQLTVIEKGHSGTTLRVVGEVAAVRHAKNVTILTLREEVERTAVIFSPVNVSEGMSVEVEGAVQLYKGAPELIISSLRSR